MCGQVVFGHHRVRLAMYDAETGLKIKNQKH